MKLLLFRLSIKQKAYFTVEATMIMPIFFFIIIFILTLGLFLYNRLLFTQNSMVLMIRGSSYTEKTYVEREKQILVTSDKLDQSYFQIDRKQTSCSRRGDDILIQRKMEQSVCTKWKMGVCEDIQEINQYDPVRFIRNIRKADQVLGKDKNE